MKLKTKSGTFTIPNHPMQAYFMGKRHGTQECMDMVAMALLDKCGFHTFSETPEDHMSIEFMFHATEDTADSINKGYLKRKDIKAMLAEEANIRFVDDGVK